jgi:hypothetical protein
MLVKYVLSDDIFVGLANVSSSTNVSDFPNMSDYVIFYLTFHRTSGVLQYYICIRKRPMGNPCAFQWHPVPRSEGFSSQYGRQLFELIRQREHTRSLLWHRYSVTVNQVIVATVKLPKWWLQLKPLGSRFHG